MNKNKIVVLISGVLVILLIVVSVSFAIFRFGTDSTSQELVLGDIWMKYTESNGISLENALPGDEYTNYFEFTITGTNTYTKKDIWYDISLTHGDTPAGKTEDNRVEDKYLKFKLTEVNGESETEIFTDKTYDDLTNKRVHVDTISKSTNEYSKTYRLYMVISEELTYGNSSDAILSTEEFGKIFGSIKVNVTGDFNEKELPIESVNFVDAVKAKYVIDQTLVAVNTDGDLYQGTGEIREYRYSGPVANNYVFFDTDGDGEKDTNEIWRVIGIFEDNGEEKVKLVRNIMLQDEEMPTNYLINGTTYTIKTGNNVYWNSVPSGTYPSANKNDWTKAGLQYYLNTEKDENTIENTGYLSFFSNESESLISPITYYLGNVYYNVDTVKNAYIQERGTVECSASITSNSHSNNCNIWNENQASWNGLIGLMYPSDYGYSASNLYWKTDMYGWLGTEEDGVVASSTSWMQQMLGHSSNTEWFLSPSSSTSNVAMYWGPPGGVDRYNVGNVNGVRPVLYLKSNTKVIDAAGTEGEPFVVVIE